MKVIEAKYMMSIIIFNKILGESHQQCQTELKTYGWCATMDNEKVAVVAMIFKNKMIRVSLPRLF